MRRHWVAVVAVVLALVLVESWAPAQPRGGGRGPGGATRGMFMQGRGGSSMYLPDLTSSIQDLTDAQRKQIAAIREAAIAKIEQIQKQMNVDIKRQVLNPEQITVMEQAERARTHRGPGGVILTDEQLAKYNALRAEIGKIEDREARGEAYKKMFEEMQATYTDEQKKQAADMRARFTRGRGNRGGGAPGGGAPGGGGNR